MFPRMKGIDSLANLYKFRSIIPLLMIKAFVLSWATICVVRSTLTYPDLIFDRRNNPEPWNRYKNRPYKKYIDTGLDHVTKSHAPDY
ncbi:cytochrome c oxidase subunit NDUFA4-like [Ctenocephalides felis]|uniref:cytochrome c oxidase subunit NDUFA4-like n=1 Tax=Ctenocephalides felis TaxID=7515 RepID=UPI000E6E50CD|nr:cytochrome c oxidase subunit NDUFA4-like [Ctenocephalides felis]